MKKFFFFLLMAGVVSLTACNSAGSGEKKDGDSTKTEQKAAADNTHAWICPHNCEGSGSNEAGKCKVCGMDLVANPNAPKSEAAPAQSDTPHTEGHSEGH